MKYPRLTSIIQNLLTQNVPHKSIQLAVGELIFNEIELHREWGELTKETSLSKMKLNIRVIPAEQQCMWCFLIYHPTENETTCPQCKAVGAKILKGEEFYLETN